MFTVIISYTASTRLYFTFTLYCPWNNGKSGAKLDLTSSTTPGLQIHKFDHSRTANLCDWLLCRRAALPLVGCPHSIVYLHLPVVEGLIFCISATPHLGTSFPLFHGLNSALLSGNILSTVYSSFYAQVLP